MTDNPARPAPGARICALADLTDGEARVIDFAADDARFSLILARLGDAVTAYENVCPHARFPLDRPDGRVSVQSGEFLVCAAHGASFRIRDGVHCGGPGKGRLQPFAIEVLVGEIRSA